MDLTAIPVVDNHCHSLLREQPKTAEDFHRFFTESYFPEIAKEHVQHTIFYQWSLRALADFYGCEPRADAIMEKRGKHHLRELVHKTVTDAKIHGWLVDYGYSTTETFGHDELAPMVNCRVESILRLEPLLEQLIKQAASFDDLHDAYLDRLKDLRGQGLVSLKSIIAYRAGLQLGEANRDDARAEFKALKERATREGKLRLDSKPTLDYFIPLAVEQASAQEFPIQIHTGFGDPDQDLAKVNPAFLRPLFADKYRGAKIVLLHASYPYCRTSGYLAAVYPNVYADFGLAIPFAAGDTRAILRELLGLAPASKVMYSSDAFHIPELYWLGAKLGRRALGEVLGEYVTDGMIDEATALGMAELILHGNAEKVYEL